MAIFFFGNPVLSKLEDLLWEKARQRYIEEGRSPIEDIIWTDREVRNLLKDWVTEWRAEEDQKLKPVWNEFKRTVTDQTNRALIEVIGASDQAWYAVEIGSLPSFPEVIAVPYEVLKRKTEEALPSLLVQKIEFKDMLPETREALAKYAIERNFGKVINNARKHYQNFEIRGRHDQFVFVDVRERDFYHLGENTAASRIDMVMLGAFRANISDRDKAKHMREKEAVKQWSERRKHRRDDRRFSGKGWGYDQTSLDKMARS